LLCLVNNDNQPKTTTMNTNANHLDNITRKLTMFPSFSALLTAEGNYRPSFYLTKGKLGENLQKQTLAMAYDDHQQMRGDNRRAYRGNW
jgi:hypothetical protein